MVNEQEQVHIVRHGGRTSAQVYLAHSIRRMPPGRRARIAEPGWRESAKIAETMPRSRSVGAHVQARVRKRCLCDADA
jgi:hypothetical protein